MIPDSSCDSLLRSVSLEYGHIWNDCESDRTTTLWMNHEMRAHATSLPEHHFLPSSSFDSNQFHLSQRVEALDARIAQ